MPAGGGIIAPHLGRGPGEQFFRFLDQRVIELHKSELDVNLLAVTGVLFVVYFWNLDQKLMAWLYTMSLVMMRI